MKNLSKILKNWNKKVSIQEFTEGEVQKNKEIRRIKLNFIKKSLSFYQDITKLVQDKQFDINAIEFLKKLAINYNASKVNEYKENGDLIKDLQGSVNNQESNDKDSPY